MSGLTNSKGITAISNDATAVSSGSTSLANVQNIVPANVFNRWRLALANVRNGTSNARILCIGDSTTSGIGDSTAATIPATNSYPTRLASFLNSVVTPTIVSLAVPLTSAASNADNRWTLGTGWSKVGIGFGAAGTAAFSGTSTALNLVYTASPQVNCDGFYIYYLGSGTVGTITATASGGTPQVIVASGLASGIYRSLIPAASASSSNTLTITSTLATNYIVGAEPVLSTKMQVLVGNSGCGGVTSTSWNSTGAFAGLSFIGTVAPDLSIISLGINDAAASISAATYQTNIQAIITKCKLSGDVILCDPLPNQTAGTIAIQKTYLPVLSSLATSNNCVYASIFNRWGGAYNSNYMNADGTHAIDQGYWDWSEFIANIIANP